jgi:hypothetical protein
MALGTIPVRCPVCAEGVETPIHVDSVAIMGGQAKLALRPDTTALLAHVAKHGEDD